MTILLKSHNGYLHLYCIAITINYNAYIVSYSIITGQQLHDNNTRIHGYL